MANKDDPQRGQLWTPPSRRKGVSGERLLKTKLAVAIFASLLLVNMAPFSQAHRIQRKRQTQDPPAQPPQPLPMTNAVDAQSGAQAPTNTQQEAQYADAAPAEGDPPPAAAPPVDQGSKQEERQQDQAGQEVEISFDAEKQALEFAKNKNLPMVMRLMPKITKFDFDDGTSEGTLLHYAAFHGWTNVMDILVKEKNVSPTMENQYDKRTPLLSACRGGRLDSVKYCIKSLKKNDWSASNENGLTCSHFAAREGHPEILSYMIELNKLADIPLSVQSHKADKKLQWTPLHYAANNGHTECAIILLLEAGANPYKRGFRMQSAIDLARARGDKMLVDIMHDPLKFKITSLLDASLGLERKAREKAITALREDILKLKEALHSAGPEGEHAGMPGSAPAMIPQQGNNLQQGPPAGVPARVKRSLQMFDQGAPVQAQEPQAMQPAPTANRRAIMENFHGFGSAGLYRSISGGPIKRDVGSASGLAGVADSNVTNNVKAAGTGNNVTDVDFGNQMAPTGVPTAAGLANPSNSSASQQDNGQQAPESGLQNQPQQPASPSPQSNDPAGVQEQQNVANNSLPSANAESNQTQGNVPHNAAPQQQDAASAGMPGNTAGLNNNPSTV